MTPRSMSILVQLLLPKSINETTITNAVVAEKDVDGFGPLNVGELAKERWQPALCALHAQGCHGSA